jgi:hypothetical protein
MGIFALIWLLLDSGVASSGSPHALDSSVFATLHACGINFEQVF